MWAATTALSCQRSLAGLLSSASDQRPARKAETTRAGPQRVAESGTVTEGTRTGLPA
jgi:hypothetical protein